jgi:hypothetical protein
MSDNKKSKSGAPAPERDEPLRDLPTPHETNTDDQVRGGVHAPASPSPIPIPYPN